MKFTAFTSLVACGIAEFARFVNIKIMSRKPSKLAPTVAKKKAKPKKAKKKRHGIEEYRIQAKFIEICRAKSATCWKYRWVHSVPYGFRATIGLAIKMKKEGSNNGVADVFVPVPNSEYSGFYLEFKRKYGYQRPEQKMFQQYCARVGYKYLVVKSAVQALTELDIYLDNYKPLDKRS